ncbi:hypothetical protein BZA70DRAFT_286630 [Myxozyma melibiosi]|uniref:C2H2-type domain-containing protein n=1 Tax=Myxozyma melibiosi TaxID=54550 RepID=A0ABR1FBQ7_9ASCO
MPPRSFKPVRSMVNPAPRTEAAKQALKAFHCDLCQKGYSRMDEYETHISSYEHQHKKRYNELKQMQKDSSMTAEQRREREMRESGMRTISLDSIQVSTTTSSSTAVAAGGAPSTAKAGFKSIGGGGFKKFGSKAKTATTPTAAASTSTVKTEIPRNDFANEENSDSEIDADYEHYDPRHPTSP